MYNLLLINILNLYLICEILFISYICKDGVRIYKFVRRNAVSYRKSYELTVISIVCHKNNIKFLLIKKIKI